MCRHSIGFKSRIESSILQLFYSVYSQNKITGTIWHDIDDLRAFQILDLKDIEKMFSAYQRQQVRFLLSPCLHCRQGGHVGLHLCNLTLLTLGGWGRLWIRAEGLPLCVIDRSNQLSFEIDWVWVCFCTCAIKAWALLTAAGHPEWHFVEVCLCAHVHACVEMKAGTLLIKVMHKTVEL